jgi:hypothetical protein
MDPLTRADLFSLEQYAEKRTGFRAQVIEHKKHRRVDVGPNLSLYFEDRLTVQYQVQEMLRIERIFEADAIEEELEAYNPLIPDGSNLKCTAMFEFLTPKMISALAEGGTISFGVEHDLYRYQVRLNETTRQALLGDLSLN